MKFFLGQYGIRIFVLVLVCLMMFNSSIIQVDAKGNDKNIKTTQNSKNTKSKQNTKNTKTKQKNKNKKHDKHHKGHGHKKHNHKGHKPVKPELKNKEVYKMLDGVNQEYNGSGVMIFRSNAEFKKFTAVFIDGEIVSSDNYTVTEGSTIITLKEDYCKTLSEGEHTIQIISDNGKYATTTFTVEQKTIEITLISGKDFNAIIPIETTSIEFLSTAAPESANIDVSEMQDGSAMAWIEGTTFYVAPKVEGQILCANPDSSYMFDKSVETSDGPYSELNIESIFFNNFDTSKVTNMECMFRAISMNISSDQCTMYGLENWDTSNVTNMSCMFSDAFYYNDSVYLNLSKWETSNVQDMSGMFTWMGNCSESVIIEGLNNWNTSNVTNMTCMFSFTGQMAETWNIGQLNNWNVSKVTNMYGMFEHTGKYATSWDIGTLSEWDTSSVTNMGCMFDSAAIRASYFELNLSNWNVSKVTSLYRMFNGTGMNATTCSIGALSNWDVSNVTSMHSLFSSFGNKATNLNIGNLDNWNTSNVTDMYGMFDCMGKNATTFNIGNLSTKEVTVNGKTYTAWDVSNVTDVSSMFYNTGLNADYSLDLSNWNVQKGIKNNYFATGVVSKLKLPQWKY